MSDTHAPVLRMHASYLHEAIFRPEVIEQRARELLAGIEYDTLVGTGLSGALVLPALARALGKTFAVVRKPDNSHSRERVEGSLGRRWVFVDDLIFSGDTLTRVRTEIAAISQSYGHATEYVGAFLYHHNRFRTP